MMGKKLEDLLNSYTVPSLAPDVVSRAIDAALRQPQTHAQRPLRQRRPWLVPVTAFMMGGLATAAIIVFVLPMTNLPLDQTAWTADQVQLAENDIRTADEIFGLLETPVVNDQQIENLSDPAVIDGPIWDTFMGRS